jgi:hypothetical protein
MQVMLNIPDVIPQEIVNRILKQVESQLQIEEKLARKFALSLLQPNDEAIKAKARQNLTQMVNKLRDSAEELGVVSEEEISAWVNEARVKNARHY